MRSFIKLLAFFRLVDAEDGRMSITNTALIILVTKLALLPKVELPDLAAFFLALAAYSHKRVLNNKKTVAPADSPPVFDGQGVVAALQAKVRDLEAFMGSVKLGSNLGGRRG